MEIEDTAYPTRAEAGIGNHHAAGLPARDFGDHGRDGFTFRDDHPIRHAAIWVVSRLPRSDERVLSSKVSHSPSANLSPCTNGDSGAATSTTPAWTETVTIQCRC